MQDTDYVINFIKNCNDCGKISAEEICNEAITKIAELDELFKERIKLSSVLRYFNYKKRSPANLVPTENNISFKHIDKSVAMTILNKLHNNTKVSIEDLMSTINDKTGEQKKGYFLIIKQLLESNVILKENNGNFIRGDKYYSFIQK